MFWGRVGEEPDMVWDESGFPFVKLGVSDGFAFQPYPVVDAPNPFDEVDLRFKGFRSAEYEILNAYPNPFNPHTTLTYTMETMGGVSLEVYNISGSLVAKVFNGFQTAGVHEVSFNAASLPSGIYIAQLHAGGRIQTEKLLLIK